MGEFVGVSSALQSSLLPHFHSRRNFPLRSLGFTATRERSGSVSFFHNPILLQYRYFQGFPRSRVSNFAINSISGGKEPPIASDNNGDSDSGTNRHKFDKSDLRSEEKRKKMLPISMSQKLTLVYAVVVGVGGLMGFIKTGSQKSLAAGGSSALLLWFVYVLLPAKPALASVLGMGVSSALLVMMGSRFRNSGKVFPAGIVALASLVMSGGYLHGLLRSIKR